MKPIDKSRPPKVRTVPIIICEYRRVDRLHTILDQLIAPDEYIVKVFIWNNNPKEREHIETIIKLYPDLKIYVRHSKTNIGGFGRFYLAKRIRSQYPFIIFIDDDVHLGKNAISTLVHEFKPKTIHSFYAFKFKTRENYFMREKLKSGDEADYCGTGGMICDTSIFGEKELFGCPKEYWFIEDLWLSYYASHLLGWKLYKSNAKFSIVVDGKDQYVKLKNLKTTFLQYLIIQGWDVARDPLSFYDRFINFARKLLLGAVEIS